MPQEPQTHKITDAQLVLLSSAAGRPDGAVLPPPSSMTVNRGALAKVISSLLKNGCVTERPAHLGDEIWRSDDDDRYTVAITSLGRQAIGIDDQGGDGGPLDIDTAAGSTALTTGLPHQPAASTSSPTSHKSSPNAPSKLSLLVDLMKQPEGATIVDLMNATGWQAHSVRGAISGSLKKKLGLQVTSEPMTDRGRVYRITGGGAAQ